MKKYLALIYLSMSVMSFAQFKDNNAFDQEQSKVGQHSQDLNSSGQGEMKQQPFGGDVDSSDGNVESIGPGNPGEPAPIDGFVPILLISGLILILYYQRRNKKINI